QVAGDVGPVRAAAQGHVDVAGRGRRRLGAEAAEHDEGDVLPQVLAGQARRGGDRQRGLVGLVAGVDGDAVDRAGRGRGQPRDHLGEAVGAVVRVDVDVAHVGADVEDVVAGGGEGHGGDVAVHVR